MMLTALANRRGTKESTLFQRFNVWFSSLSNSFCLELQLYLALKAKRIELIT